MKSKVVLLAVASGLIRQELLTWFNESNPVSGYLSAVVISEFN
ncbi:hypothetical protein [Colwellia piezophila]|nr:hypothetical protein [Colwellia piezophila]